MFKVRKQIGRRSSAVLPVGGVVVAEIRRGRPGQLPVLEDTGDVAVHALAAIDIRHHGGHLQGILRRDRQLQLRQAVEIIFLVE